MNKNNFDGTKSSDTTRMYKQSFAGFYLAMTGLALAAVVLVVIFSSM